MSKVAGSKAVAGKLRLENNVTFPRALREAIPEHQPSVGRCLKLESVDAQGAHTEMWGRRVQIKLRVCETGKLSGAFDVWVDVEVDAARGLAELIHGAVEMAEKMPAGKGSAGFSAPLRKRVQAGRKPAPQGI